MPSSTPTLHLPLRLRNLGTMSATPRVLILSDRFPPHDRGGAERIAYYHAVGLRDRGYQVSVFTSHEPGGAPRIADEDGIEVHRMFPIHPFSSHDPPSAADKAVGFPGMILHPGMTRLLRQTCEHARPDLLHAHYIVRISYGAFVRAAPEQPHVLTFHGYQYECPKGGLYRKRGEICHEKPLPCRAFTNIMTRELSPVDRILAISRFIEARLIDAGHDSNRVTYVPNGVPGLEARVTSPTTPNRDVLFVGRLVPNKGVAELIEAFRSIKDSTTLLRIVGDGTDRPRLERLAAGDERIRFEGWLGSDTVAERYRQSRVVAVPSLWHEVMNTVVCEAQSWGRPVVATRVGGNGDLIENGTSGFLCEPGDVAALAARIGSLLADDTLAEQIGEAGRTHVDRYSMDRHIDALESVYRELGVEKIACPLS